MRTHLLTAQRTSKIPRAHRTTLNAKSPEVLHAVLTRLASLPTQPVLHFLVKPEKLDIDSAVGYHKPSKDIQRDAALANIQLRDLKTIPHVSEDELVVEEALRPTGLVYLTDGNNDNNNNNENNNSNNGNNNNENENQEGGGLNDETIAANISTVGINPSLISAVRDSYDGVEKFDIPVYFVVFAPEVPGGGHMSILIVHKTLVYSVGFGYYGALKEPFAIAGVPIGIPASLLGKGTLYNPDFLIDAKKITENMSVKYNYTIVDFGYCKPKHLRRIEEIANNNLSQVFIEFKRGQFKTTNIPLSSQYHAASIAQIASLKKGAMNCTTFVEHIFKETVDCKVIKMLPFSISHPAKCVRKKGKVTNADIKNWFDEYNNAAPFYSPNLNRFLEA